MVDLNWFFYQHKKLQESSQKRPLWLIFKAFTQLPRNVLLQFGLPEQCHAVFSLDPQSCFYRKTSISNLTLHCTRCIQFHHYMYVINGCIALQTCRITKNPTYYICFTTLCNAALSTLYYIVIYSESAKWLINV